MAKNDAVNNSSRLSLALEALPLTPIGMKSPSTYRKKKLEKGEKQNKLSLRRLRPLHEDHYTLPPPPPPDAFVENENFKFPQNVENVTTRRRMKNKYKGKENTVIKEKDRVNKIESIPQFSDTPEHCHLGSVADKERRDSIFTDIDEGSFIEFTQNPSECLPNLSMELLPQFYYTCTDDNETKYSTSSKAPLAPVGFHKFVNAVKSRNVLNKIAEESSSKEDMNNIKNSFRLDESVIAGSRDILVLKSQGNLNRVLNSTEYSFNRPNVYEVPNISSLTLHNSVSDDRHKSKPNEDCCKPRNDATDYECVILSESDDEVEVMNKIAAKVPHHLLHSQGNHNEKDYISESLFTEDISILSSIPDCQKPGNLCHGKQDNHNFKVQNDKYLGSLPFHYTKRESKIGRLNEEIICSSDADKRVVGWVMSSPFKDGSFGSSFMKHKIQPPTDTESDNKKSAEFDSNYFPEKNLPLGFSSEHCCNEGSGNTVFTLERVAELPRNKEIVEYVQQLSRVEESDSSDSGDENGSYRKVSPNKDLYPSLDSAENVSILSLNPECHKYEMCDSKGSDSLKREKISVKSKDVDGIQSYQFSSNENSSEEQIPSRYSGKNVQFPFSPIIIYDSYNSEEELERKGDSEAPHINNELHKPSYLSPDTSHWKEKNVTGGSVINKNLNSPPVSNSELVLSSAESESSLDEANLSAQLSKFRISSKHSLSVLSNKKYGQNIVKSPSDCNNLNATLPIHNSPVTKSSGFASQTEASQPKDVASNMSFHLHLTADDSIRTDFSLKDPKTTPQKKSTNLNSFNSPNLNQYSLHKRNGILKSKSSTQINHISHDISSDESLPDIDLSSDGSLPDIELRKSLTKSQSMKHLTCRASDSEIESSFQKLSREFNKVYKDFRHDEPKTFKSKTVQKVDFSRKPLFPAVSQSVTQEKRKPLIERENSIPKLCISASDKSDDNFEDYIEITKKNHKAHQQLSHRPDSDSDFIVSDDDVEYTSSSPSPKRVLKKGTVNIHPTEISNRKKTAPKYNSKWRNTRRIISSSSSSDSEEERTVFRKPRKVSELKTPKAKPVSVTKKQVLKTEKAPVSKNSFETLSFFASLAADTSLSRVHIDAIPFLRHFKKQKDALTQKLYLLFNANVFNNRLPSLMKITWNSRMTKTAGFCYYQMDKSKPSGRGARIELSTKVIDAPGRLRETLIHELCHAASWIISGYKDGHGPLWKSWANKAMRAFPELPFIGRCHSYEINCKYTYKCSNCGYSIGRHSKSLDTEKKVCGYCYGKFELFVNFDPKGSAKKGQTHSDLVGSTPRTPRTPSGFALYVKENYGSIKRTKKSLKHKDIMKALSEDFAKLKTKA